ncbi:MAG: OmpA family protein [Flavobacteriaceae bacterium]|nr:OmpA family protein [Flavobacteriaceae bacterium]
MKKFTFFLALIFCNLLIAQDFPANPEPGKCYVRCISPDVYENRTERVMVQPAYTVLKVLPAEYKTVTERVVVKEASKKYRIIPAKYGKETVSYTKKAGGSSLKVVPASFKTGSQQVQIKPAYEQWEYTADYPDCVSPNPEDCKQWCYKSYPAEFRTINVQELAQDATTTSSSLAESRGTYTKTVVTEAARVEEIDIPAEYREITKTVMVNDARTVKETIDAVYKDVTVEVLKEKGGVVSWKAVECDLVEYQALPINWNLGSATLTSKAKSIIDTKLMPLLEKNKGVKLEIASHTDSRGSASSNQDLSERRARAVVEYLANKGINRSLLVANGYGERRLKNRCADGVSCTEREHLANRRTEFRLIN